MSIRGSISVSRLTDSLKHRITETPAALATATEEHEEAEAAEEEGAECVFRFHGFEWRDWIALWIVGILTAAAGRARSSQFFYFFIFKYPFL